MASLLGLSILSTKPQSPFKVTSQSHKQNMIYYFTNLAALTTTVSPFPFIWDMPGVDTSLIMKRSSEAHVKR